MGYLDDGRCLRAPVVVSRPGTGRLARCLPDEFEPTARLESDAPSGWAERLAISERESGLYSPRPVLTWSALLALDSRNCTPFVLVSEPPWPPESRIGVIGKRCWRWPVALWASRLFEVKGSPNCSARSNEGTGRVCCQLDWAKQKVETKSAAIVAA